MNAAYLNPSELSFFSDAQEQFSQLINQLSSETYASSEHGDVEKHINQAGQELLRRLLQGWLDLKATNEEQKSTVKNALGEALNHVRTGTARVITSLFGDVTVTRKGYSQRRQSSVFPLDAELNLPADPYSDGMRHRLSKEALRGSFDDAIEVITETTGGSIPKRQSLNLARDAAQDFECFYQQKRFKQPVLALFTHTAPRQYTSP